MGPNSNRISEADPAESAGLLPGGQVFFGFRGFFWCDDEQFHFLYQLLCLPTENQAADPRQHA